MGKRLEKAFSTANLLVSLAFLLAAVVFAKQGSSLEAAAGFVIFLPLFFMEMATRFKTVVFISRILWIGFCSLMLWSFYGQPNYIYVVAIFAPLLICNYASLMQNFALRLKEVGKNYPLA